MANRTRVYIAGPMTNGGQGYNTKRIHEAVDAYCTLIEHGFTPHCPQLTMLCDMLFPGRISHADWLVLDKRYINNSDVVLRLPGKSLGADEECIHAINQGIPVVRGLGEFFDQFPY